MNLKSIKEFGPPPNKKTDFNCCVIQLCAIFKQCIHYYFWCFSSLLCRSWACRFRGRTKHMGPWGSLNSSKQHCLLTDWSRRRGWRRCQSFKSARTWVILQEWNMIINQTQAKFLFHVVIDERLLCYITTLRPSNQWLSQSRGEHL